MSTSIYESKNRKIIATFIFGRFAAGLFVAASGCWVKDGQPCSFVNKLYMEDKYCVAFCLRQYCLMLYWNK